MKRKNRVHTLLTIIIGVLWLLPVFYLMNVALKPASELYSAGVFTVVKNPTAANFLEAWEKIRDYLLNSLLYVLTSVPLATLLASLAAFGVMRLGPGKRNLGVNFFMIGMLVPVHVTLLPNYMTMMKIGMLDSRLGLILMYTVFNIPFAFYLLYGAFMNVSREIEEAAVIDGASPWQVYFHVFLPVSRPGIVISALINFIGVWNELIFANTFIQSNTKLPITTGLLQFVGEFTTAYEKITAGILMSALPVIILFLLFRKSIMTGMTEGALKG